MIELFSMKQVAAKIGIAYKNLAYLAITGRLPEPTYCNGKQRYYDAKGVEVLRKNEWVKKYRVKGAK